jgi:hypothetical protein
MTDNVIRLDGGREGPSPTAQQMAACVAEAVRRCEEEGDKPTACVTVIFDDDGNFRVAWDATRSRLPSAAIMDGPPRCTCE